MTPRTRARNSSGQMPAARTISLADVKNPNDSFNFVQDRLSGAEHYQATWVRLENVRLVDPAGWGADAELTITDGTYTLPLKLGLTGFDAMPAPSGPFDVMGIFDQEGWNLRYGQGIPGRLLNRCFFQNKRTNSGRCLSSGVREPPQ